MFEYTGGQLRRTLLRRGTQLKPAFSGVCGPKQGPTNGCFDTPVHTIDPKETSGSRERHGPSFFRNRTHQKWISVFCWAPFQTSKQRGAIKQTQQKRHPFCPQVWPKGSKLRSPTWRHLLSSILQLQERNSCLPKRDLQMITSLTQLRLAA